MNVITVPRNAIKSLPKRRFAASNLKSNSRFHVRSKQTRFTATSYNSNSKDPTRWTRAPNTLIHHRLCILNSPHLRRSRPQSAPPSAPPEQLRSRLGIGGSLGATAHMPFEWWLLRLPIHLASRCQVTLNDANQFMSWSVAPAYTYLCATLYNLKEPRYMGCFLAPFTHGHMSWSGSLTS